MENSKKEDFDFLLGKWKIKNRRLRERLKDCNEWDEFPGEIEVRKTLNGFANVDEYKANYNGEDFHAVTMRVFNPIKKTWMIYWLDTFSYRMLPQVEGGFREGMGEFFGEEDFNGKIVKLRFLWLFNSDNSVQWNQAYFNENKNEWEINWIMDFSRIQ